MEIKTLIILSLCITIGLLPLAVKALTAPEIEAQIAALRAKIAELKQALVQLQQKDCHTRPLWDWAYCTIACPCEAGQGDCNSNLGCKTGYCALDVGAKYDQLAFVDVCEVKPGQKQETTTKQTTQQTTKKTTTTQTETQYAKPNQVETCADSEEGDKTTDFNTAGYIDIVRFDGTKQRLYDICLANEPGGAVVKDYYCYSLAGKRYYGSEEKSCACANSVCTGETVKKAADVDVRTITDCSDSDGKDNFSTKGYVELTYDDGESKKVYDTCYQTNDREAVKDYYCRWRDGKFDYQSTIKYCPCSDGACIAEAALCTETDGGENIYEAGEAFSASGNSIADACGFADSTKGILREAVCRNNVPAHTVLHCPTQASYCRYGKCAAFDSPICTETDGGIESNIKGSVTEATIKNGKTYTDFCANSTTLKEYYCPAEDQQSSFQTINCPFGCYDGACKASAG